ncbi:MAG: hypothetical protein R3F60_17575 [bacterium]
MERRHEALPGVQVFRAPTPLPPGEGNVRLVALFVAEGQACMELEYPYG